MYHFLHLGDFQGGCQGKICSMVLRLFLEGILFFFLNIIVFKISFRSVILETRGKFPGAGKAVKSHGNSMAVFDLCLFLWVSDWQFVFPKVDEQTLKIFTKETIKEYGADLYR